MNKRIKTLSNHILLHLGGSRGQGTRGQSTSLRRRHWLRRRLLARARWHTSISSMLIELDLLVGRTSSWHGTTTSSSTGHTACLLHRISPSSPLLRHDAAIWHWIASTALLAHHWVHSRSLSPATAGSHHLWHGHLRICRLHCASWTRPLHVHRHTRIAHGTSHRSTHHTWLAGTSWTSSTVGMLSLQLRTSHFSSLSKSHKDWLVRDEFTIHLIHGSSGFLWCRKADKPESTGSSILHVLHDTGRSDGTHNRELVTKHIVGDTVIKILDVEIDALEFGDAIHLLGLVFGPQFALTFCLLLSSAYIQFAFDFFSVKHSLVYLAVQGFDGRCSSFVFNKINKAETKRLDLLLVVLLFLGCFLFLVLASFGRLLSVGVLLFIFFLLFGLFLFADSLGYGSTGNLSKLSKFLVQTIIVPFVWNVLHVAICKVVLAWTFVATDEMANLHFLPVDQHTIQLVNGRVGSLGGLVVDVAISLGLSGFAIRHDLARQNVSKEAKGIVELFVIDGFMQVLDKDVANARATEGGVTLAPHDTAWLALDHGEVHGIKSTFRVTQLMVVHVGVSQGAASDGITANTDRGNGTDSVEDLKQETLVDIRGKITDVQRRRMEGSGTFSSSRRTSRGGHGRSSDFHAWSRNGIRRVGSCSRHDDGAVATMT
mmetsp:Transcript_4315/g.7659  ORF Transcript_4315/g.7659 Transcript_4315/m.7659 type:complete len:655 (+) Transcript_4315:323-2287(+)